jgi:hypothetical protein
MTGFKAEEGKEYQVEVTTYAVYSDGNASSEKDEDGKYINLPTVLDGEGNVKNNKVVFNGDDYIFSEHMVDVSFPFEDKTFDYFKDASGGDGKSIIESSFVFGGKRKVEYENAGTEKEYEVGLLKVYNQFIDSSGELNLGNSHIVINFNYYNSNGGALDEVPKIYLMYFYLYN